MYDVRMLNEELNLLNELYFKKIEVQNGNVVFIIENDYAANELKEKLTKLLKSIVVDGVANIKWSGHE